MKLSYKDFDLGRVLKVVRGLKIETADLYKDFDDVSTGTLFADIFSPVLRYCRITKSWWLYDGIVWKEDTEQHAEYFAQLLSRAVWAYAMTSDSKQLADYAYRLKKNHTRVTMLKDASAQPVMSLDKAELDRRPGVINLENGVLDLETLELMDHDPDFLLSKCAGVRYDPDAPPDEVRKFIGEIMCHDEELVKYLQKLTGLLLTEDTYLNEFYILFGPTTRNGKSTYTETVAAMLGDYAANCEPETLSQGKRDGRTASPDLARLQGVRFLSVSEAPLSMLLDAALIKKLTGSDTLTARMLHENPVQFRPCFKLIMGTNFLPAVNDPTLFSSERVRIIPFNRKFSPEEQDKHIKERLQTPDNLSGLLNWSIEGLRLFKLEGLDPPAGVLNATDQYQAESDKLALFLQEECEKAPEYRSTMADLYEKYQRWCLESGYKAEGKRNFKQSLNAKNILLDNGTVNGRTVHNVVEGYRLLHPLETDSEVLDFLDDLKMA